jgi:hypothetical protein
MYLVYWCGRLTADFDGLRGLGFPQLRRACWRDDKTACLNPEPAPAKAAVLTIFSSLPSAPCWVTGPTGLRPELAPCR